MDEIKTHKYFALITIIVSSLLIINTIPQISAVDFPINVWPKPRTFLWPHPQVIPLSHTFTISHPNHPYLSRAVHRYRKQFFAERHRPLVPPRLNVTSATPLSKLIISVADVTAPLIHGVNESYVLTIPAGLEWNTHFHSNTTGFLIAQTPWGALRALETLSQLVYGNKPYIAAGIQITDWPIYLHRGVMLDTSRNYYGVDDLLRLVRAMSMNKLNVFHWHITDSHSFPLVLPSEPELAGRGAYGPDMVYTAEDVKKVVEFGLEYGVRVVPEIDMPAHTGSWAEAYTEIVTCANMFWSSGLAAEPGTGQLNPLNLKTYHVVKNVVRDVASLFPDTFYHAGADEVNPNCWKTDKSIQEFIKHNGTLSQVLEIFIKSTLPYIFSLNKTVVYWEDVLLDGTIKVDASLLPPEKVILQTWNNGPTNTKKIVGSGYRAIVSSSDYYYLDCGHGDFTGNNSLYMQPPGTDQGNGGSWCGPFKTWQLIYNYDITYGLSTEEAKLVLGGEVALWSEQADSTVLDSRIWPRTSAMAEAMWSGNVDEKGEKRVAEATDRLHEWRHRMVGRGVAAEPIQPLWCIKNPGMCNQ